ncbi:hypothetical protein KAR91_42120 [Candidatus Pacearchaeota archaeon]|nr:hypothetical protein [Candidatus Pacearchaeota archaeon]
MFSEDQLIAIDLIHTKEEEVALRLMSEGASWEGIAGAMWWAGLEVISDLQVKYGACIIVVGGIFI